MADWQITARVHRVYHVDSSSWGDSSRDIPTFTIPRMLAPTVKDVRERVRDILNPFGEYRISFDIYDHDGYRVFKNSTAVNSELFRRTAPKWNCVDYPDDGPHYTPQDHCVWCGETTEQISKGAS